MNFDIAKISDKVADMTIAFAPKVFLAALTLLLGFWVINRIVRITEGLMHRHGMDISLSRFLKSLLSVALKVLLIFSAVEILGFKTTSFVAILGALMVGIGMALNGSLGNLASGVMLMIFKPYNVGDLVELGGGSVGTVEAINAFSTSLATLDNKRIYVANSNVTGNTITNISGQGIVGVELTFGIGYDDSIDKARDVILRVGESCPYILDDPTQGVVVAELADNSVNLATRPFVKSEHYWDTMFYMQENVKKEFDKANIGIPFPQMDVHVKN